MTHLLDGPAAGKRLELRGAAYLLRVTINGKGEIDALDQPTDTPRNDETIYVYRLKEWRGNMHIRCGGNQRHRSGFYPIVDYVLHDEQPADDIMRSNTKWNAWRLPKTPPEYLPK